MTEGVLALHIDTLDKMAPFFLAAHVLILVLVTICLLLASRYFLHTNREQKLVRMEMGKLAEEVHLLRRELRRDKDDDSAV